MPNSPLLEAVDREIKELENLLESRRRIRQELLKSPLSSGMDVIDGWNPVVTPKTKSIELVISYLMYRGRDVSFDEMFQALSKKGAKLGGSKNERKRMGNLRAALSQNSDRVTYDKKTAMVGLARK